MPRKTKPKPKPKRPARKKTAVQLSIDREAKALGLREQGYSWFDVAHRMRVTLAVAYRLAQGALMRRRELAQAEAHKEREDHRDMQLGRLDAAMKGLWPKVRKGDQRSVTAAIRVEERRARLLGLDAPTRQEHTGPDGGPLAMSMNAPTIFIPESDPPEPGAGVAEAAPPAGLAPEPGPADPVSPTQLP